MHVKTHIKKKNKNEMMQLIVKKLKPLKLS